MLERTGSPAYTWLLTLLYVCFIINHTATSTLNWRTPLERLTGTTPDISPLLQFQWWEQVYYKLDDSDFPSDMQEKRARFVGIAEHVGHAMTFKMFTDDTHKVITRSNVRSAEDPLSPNLRLDLFDGEEAKQNVITSRSGGESKPMMVIETEELIGCTFLMEPRENGERHRARIVRAVEDHENSVQGNPDLIKFICSVNNDQYEEVVAYNDIMSHIENVEGEGNEVWQFRQIVSHEEPLHQQHPSYNGSLYNIMIEVENGELTSEPLSVIATDDPVTCAIYARNNDLLRTEGWKRFKTIAKRQKKLFRMANQAKLWSYRMTPKFQYGFEVPRDLEHAKQLDQRNGNMLWQDCTKLEMNQPDEYRTFQDIGKGKKAPEGYKKIRMHLIFAVKHDGWHKVRCVADGHLTEVPVDSVYSGVVSLRGLRMMLFIAELSGLNTWATDNGNAYLEATTSERVFIIDGTEFGEWAGHTLLISKALYGLRSSGMRWHDKFADDMRDMGFLPCKSEPDVWMRVNDGLWEYVAIYVDDLAFVM